ncbi:hypothetical protein VTK26DRAFT_3782 [Humicola hyalothermophila]
MFPRRILLTGVVALGVGITFAAGSNPVCDLEPAVLTGRDVTDITTIIITATEITTVFSTLGGFTTITLPCTAAETLSSVSTVPETPIPITSSLSTETITSITTRISTTEGTQTVTLTVPSGQTITTAYESISSSPVTSTPATSITTVSSGANDKRTSLRSCLFIGGAVALFLVQG